MKVEYVSETSVEIFGKIMQNCWVLAQNENKVSEWMEKMLIKNFSPKNE